MIARILTLLALACCANPVLAHAFPQRSEPGAGVTLKASPARVALNFSEKLEPVFSGITVTDSSGRSVAAGAVVVRGNSIFVPLRSSHPVRTESHGT